MSLLLSSIGWGLFAAGAITHAVHATRLSELLGLHFARAATLAPALIAVEAVIAIGLPIAFFAGATLLVAIVSAIAFVVAAAFTVWVTRLLITDSELPCACSFSSAPTTSWSVLRSAGCLLAALFPLANSVSVSQDIATLLTGAAIALAVFVLPDALSWPAHAKYFADSVQDGAGATVPVTMTPSQPPAGIR